MRNQIFQVWVYVNGESVSCNPDEYDERLKDASVKDIEDPIQQKYSTAEKRYF